MSNLRERIVSNFRDELKQAEIARKLGCARSVVSYNVKKWKKNKTTKDLQRSGRPRTASSKKNIKKVQKSDQKKSK